MQLKITLCRDATTWNEAPFLCLFSPNCRGKKKKNTFKKLFFWSHYHTLLMKAYIHQSSKSTVAISTKALKYLCINTKSVFLVLSLRK